MDELGYKDIFEQSNRWNEGLGDNISALKEIENQGHIIANRSELLEFCKRIRNVGGGDPLGALLPGQTHEPSSCLIANNLNFDCQVANIVDYTGLPEVPEELRLVKKNKTIDLGINGTFRIQQWVMTVEDGLVAEKISKQLNLPPVVTKIGYDNGFQLGVLLPEPIGNAAHAFDMKLAFNELKGY